MKYTDTHEWVLVDQNHATVGISKKAVVELGEIVYIEFPKVGKEVKEGQEVAVLESTKAAVDIYSPVSGTITAVNLALKENPDLINQSPEDEGWIYKVKQ